VDLSEYEPNVRNGEGGGCDKQSEQNDVNKLNEGFVGPFASQRSVGNGSSESSTRRGGGAPAVI
jgi:hypothetical protein